MLEERLRLLVKVAHLHYIDGVSQKEIAARLQLSRPMVSRMIAEAHAQGLIRIAITYPPSGALDLERELEETYGVRQAIVVRADGDVPTAASAQVAEAAATYLLRVVGPNDVLGVSAGTTIVRAIERLPQQRERHVRLVVQLFGSMGLPAQSLYDPEETVRKVTYLLQGDFVRMPVPSVLESRDIAHALRSDTRIQELLAIGRTCNVALVGIGALTPSSSLLLTRRLTPEQATRYVAMGAVGDICGRIYDSEGRPFPTSIDEQIIGITLEDLRRIPLVIAVAYGREKARAIYGSLRGGLVDTLITDAETAAVVIGYARESSALLPGPSMAH